MGARRTLLQGPGFAAVSGRDDATVSADSPAMLRIVRRESDRVQMIFRRRGDLSPFLAAVPGCHHDAACAHGKRVLPIKNVKAVEGCDETRVLTSPFKSAVRSVKNHSVRADCPTVTLIVGEADRADRVPLRQRVLPFPSAVEVLRERIRGGEAEKDNRGERDPCEKMRRTKALCWCL